METSIEISNRLPAVEKFLDTKIQKMYINGNWHFAESGTFEVRDPGTGEVIANVAAGGKTEVDMAVKAAQDAFRNSGWAKMPASERAAILYKFAELIDANTDTLVQIESLDVGKPTAQAAGFDIPNVGQTLRYYADLSVKVQRKEPISVSGYDAQTIHTPYGVCAFIFPWNFPFLLIGWGIAPALAAGNTVVIKPAEDTPLSTLYICKLAKEAGIPDGVINVVTGLGETAGAALASHPGIKRMSFTGSPEIGKYIAEQCGKNLVPVKLELGGKGAAIIFDDTDVEKTAEELAAAVTLNSGQVCCTATRWFVQEKIWDKFVAKAVSTMEKIVIGHGLSSDTQMGPVVSEKQRKRILNYLERGEKEGAKVLLRGGEAKVEGNENGFYVKPSLLAGDINNICAKEEIFGPAAFLIPFKNEEEVIEMANVSNYGLANSVWTKDPAKATRVAESLVAGNSWINAHNVFAHGIPYGGCNLSGMGGGVLGPQTYYDYLRPQSIVRIINN